MAKVKYMSKGSQQNRKSTCKSFCIFYRVYNNYFCSYKGRVLKPFPNKGLVLVGWVAVARSKAQHQDHFVHHPSVMLCFCWRHVFRGTLVTGIYVALTLFQSYCITRNVRWYFLSRFRVCKVYAWTNIRGSALIIIRYLCISALRWYLYSRLEDGRVNNAD